jgi:hypothetical protein
MLIVMLFACTAGFVMGGDPADTEVEDTGDTGVIDTFDTAVDTGSDTSVDTSVDTAHTDTGDEPTGFTRIAVDYLSMDATEGNYYDIGYEGTTTGVGVYCAPGMTADMHVEQGHFRVTMHAWDPSWVSDTKVISACVLTSDQNAIPWTLETLRPW